MTNHRFIAILLVCLLGTLGFYHHAFAAEDANACAAIADDAARLRCYDEKEGLKSAEQPETKDGQVTNETSAPNPPANANTVIPSNTPQAPAAEVIAPNQQAEAKTEPSYLSRKWQLDEESRRNRFSIVPHRANYFLPLLYNFNPNREPYEEAYPNFDMQNEEVKFQLSIKVKLWESMFKTKADLWFGYTQLSFWQLYNTSESCPFLETNYEPEILINYRMDANIFGLITNRFIQVGFNHQSNGLGGSLSRSWNRIVANFGFERGPFDMIIKTWIRIPENEDDDDNPDIVDYLGNGEIELGYHYKDWGIACMFRNNLRLDDNHSGLELDATFPLVKPISGYVQYYVGYGQSLIDYDHFDNSVGIGFLVKDW